MTARRVEPAAGTHGYDATTVSLVLRLVLEAGVSLRGVPRVLGVVASSLGLSLPIPHWTTGRLWLMRLGYWALIEPLEVADDWAWLIDHSVQIGKSKCLVILGVRTSRMPTDRCLGHHDMKLIGLVPAEQWKGPDVLAALEAGVVRSGSVPRVIASDHGADLLGGISLFRQNHPRALEVYDIKHKAACLLKRRLENSDRWKAYVAAVGRTRCLIQQTELAFATPPQPREKSRFMNLSPHLCWGLRAVRLLGRAAACEPSARYQRVVEKLGWVLDFQPDLLEWSAWQQVVDQAVSSTNRSGLYKGGAKWLARELRQLRRDRPRSSATAELAAELVRFVRRQATGLNPLERLPAGTEVLESAFGKFKRIEGQQSRGGFSHLLLGLGSIVVDLSTATTRRALSACHVSEIHDWASKNLGVTLLSVRKKMFQSVTNGG